MTLAGNLLIMGIVYSNTHFHTPMYFFLTNLSFLDITYTTVLFPKMLANFFLESTRISLTECLLQAYLFFTMVTTESILLTAMAYDRYVAICFPLHYGAIMNKTACIRLTAGTWAVGLIDAVPHIIQYSKLSYCESHTINHLFCDVTALMKLSCSSTHGIEMSNYILGTVIGLVPFALTVTSYVKIITAILKIQSKDGRRKAFSTCGSHLTVVILFYGSVCSTYMQPKSAYSMKNDKLVSLSYIAVTPLCNPIIYSLKNTEFKNTLRKTKRNM
ncbi:olfactory receptor 5V1-like [Ambystoma mexicanum]|uniref:olfactory receptor 5V1-like n=1 Tax=Ambystoma mexicanum TaxID=8296 RepID=UPI0037E7109C